MERGNHDQGSRGERKRYDGQGQYALDPRAFSRRIEGDGKEGLRAAIQNYEERHGLVKEQKPTTVEVVRRRLKKVMNPLAGLDVVRTNLVKSVDVEEGAVRVVMDLPADHQFASAMKEEIMEKIEPLWDVQEVVVEFSE